MKHRYTRNTGFIVPCIYLCVMICSTVNTGHRDRMFIWLMIVLLSILIVICSGVVWRLTYNVHPEEAGSETTVAHVIKKYKMQKKEYGSKLRTISNTLSFKRNLPPNASELPRKLNHRKLFRRSEVGRYVAQRRPSVIEEETTDGGPNREIMRRKSCFPHVPRKLSHDGRDESESCSELISGPKRNASFVSSLPPLIEITDADVETQECDKEESTEPTNIPNGMLKRRMSRRRSSISLIGRGQSRRMSVLRNEPIGIPGIPEKTTVRQSTRKSSSSIMSDEPVPQRKEKGLTANLTEFKNVFGPMAHEILMKRHKEYGPIYQFSALGQKIVFLFNIDDIEEMKKAEGRCPRHIDFKHLRLYREKKCYPQGLLISHGDDWRKQRRMLGKLMCNSVTIAQYIPAVDETLILANGRFLLFPVSPLVFKDPYMFTVASAIVDHLHDTHKDIFLPESATGRYAIEAFGRIVYGHSMGCIISTVQNDMTKFVEIARQNFDDAKKLLVVPTWLMPLHPAWKRHNERWNFLLKTTMNNIEKFRTSQCFLNRCMLNEVLENEEMADGEIFINFTDLMLASIDTTSTLLQWCLYEIGRNAHAQEEIYTEIEKVQDTFNNPIDIAQNMPYLRGIVKETLRLHPVGFMTSRIIDKDMYVRSHVIPAKTHVAMSMYVMGRNKNVFPNPEEFKPERWLTPNKEHDKFYKEVPFGFGPRMCIGKRIAEVEVLFFLMHFCRSFKFHVINDEEICHRVHLLLCPDKPIKLRITKRK